MSPRPYQLGKRQGQIEASRQRVLDAARALLAEAHAYAAFTVEAVARRADVSRATVYYQFGSKTGLLEALCDAFAEAGHMEQLGRAFGAATLRQGFAVVATTFCTFWAVDRPVMRRLRALAALDPEVATVIGARDARRRMALVALLERHGAASERGVTILHMLTSFETFEALAPSAQAVDEVVRVIVRLAAPLIGPEPSVALGG